MTRQDDESIFSWSAFASWSDLCCAVLCAGAGAVHKSPELLDGEARLLLTVDDACC